METKNRISGYDLIKLAFALAVVAFLYVAIRPTPQSRPVSDASLPAFPQANFEWEYDPNRRELLNPQGVQIYRLTTDGVTWRPIVPAALSLQLPTEYRVVQNSQRTWQILDGAGAVVSSWDTENLRWVMGLIRTPTQPRSTATVQVTATPALTPATPTNTPTAATVIPTATQTATLACNTDVQTHLAVGQPAQVLINLNLHSTPEMVENVFDGNPAGEIVDVLRGPVCVPYLNSAYWWWEIRNTEGVIGWAVEATLNGEVYFLGPLE